MFDCGSSTVFIIPLPFSIVFNVDIYEGYKLAVSSWEAVLKSFLDCELCLNLPTLQVGTKAFTMSSQFLLG